MSRDFLGDMACDAAADRAALSCMDDARTASFRFFVCHLVGLDEELPALNDLAANFLTSD